MCPTGHLAKFALLGHNAAMITNNISEIRRRSGLSQTELAERIGTTLNMLGKLERGARTLDTDWMEKIALALDVQPYELIGPIDLSQRPPVPVSTSITLPVTLPSARALKEMFVGLLEAINVDPHQDERAEQLALHFPHMFEATVLHAGAQGSGLRRGRAKPPRVDGEGRIAKR